MLRQVQPEQVEMSRAVVHNLAGKKNKKPPAGGGERKQSTNQWHAKTIQGNGWRKRQRITAAAF
jgi:hypothetical protein